MTAAERLLWSRVRGGQVGGACFRRQFVIAPYIVDFYCREAGLVVEVDGGVHECREQRERDGVRERELEAMGLWVLRFSNHQVVTRLSETLSVIEACLLEREDL